MTKQAKITVIYLCRYGNPPHFSRRFMKSLIRFPAGIDYNLLYLMKGFPEGTTDENFELLRGALPGWSGSIDVSDDLFITSAHLAGAESWLCQTEFVLCLTSWSEVLANNWLRHFADAYQRTPDCGMVGATGSFETLDDSTPFPNTHIRTTAFYMRRDEFVGAERGALKTKYDNNVMEAGANGLSKQMLNKGRRLVVVDKNGEIYTPEAWPTSLTFRAGNQENLLITDNRTHFYDKGKNRERTRLARKAWGTAITVPNNPLWRRLWIDARYRYSLFGR